MTAGDSDQLSEQDKIRKSYTNRFTLKTVLTVGTIVVAGLGSVLYQKSIDDKVDEASKLALSQIAQAQNSMSTLLQSKASLVKPYVSYRSDKIESILSEYPTDNKRIEVLDRAVDVLQTEILALKKSPEYQTYVAAQEESKKFNNRFLSIYVPSAFVLLGGLFLSDLRATRKRNQALSQLEAQVA